MQALELWQHRVSNITHNIIMYLHDGYYHKYYFKSQTCSVLRILLGIDIVIEWSLWNLADIMWLHAHYNGRNRKHTTMYI